MINGVGMRYILLCVVFSCSFSSFSDEFYEENYKSLMEENFYWYKSNTDRINELLTKNGWEIIPIVNTICGIWEYRDGAVGGEIAYTIAISFVHHPQLTFLWFEKHKDSFDGFIEELPAVLLTDYSGVDVNRIVAIKNELMRSVNAYISSVHNKKHEVMARRLVERLRSTEIYIID